MQINRVSEELKAPEWVNDIKRNDPIPEMELLEADMVRNCCNERTT
jgi:hypothetical protein